MEKEVELIIEDLKKLFNIDENEKINTGDSLEKNGVFYISKQKMERYEVIEKLQDYFTDTKVKDGYVLVNPITFVYTKFEVRNGVPKEIGL